MKSRPTSPGTTRARRVGHFALIALACAGFSCAMWRAQQPLWRGLDNLAEDFYFRSRGAVSEERVAQQPHTRDIVCVVTTHQLPRPLLARLIDRLSLARVVALDFMLVDDQKSFEPGEEAYFQPEIARWERETLVLANSIRRHGRVVVAAWPEEERASPLGPPPGQKAQAVGPQLMWRRPPDSIWNAARARAHVVVWEEGGLARRVPLWQNIAPRGQKPQMVPCLGLALAALSRQQSPQSWARQWEMLWGQRQSDSISGSAATGNAGLDIDWLGGREVFGGLSNSIGYMQVLDLWEPEDFRDKIVVVGEVSRQAKEISLTPWGEVPSMQAHATTAAMLLNPCGPLRPVPVAALLALSLAGALALALPLGRWPLWASFVCALAQGVGVAALGAWLFEAQRLVLAPSPLIGTLVLGLNAVALYEYRRTRHTLGRFIGQEMMARSLHPLEALEPGGREEVATAMFCDVRGYSSLAETLPPAQTTRLINAYTTLLLRAAEPFGGRAIDYQGDGVFILFEASPRFDRDGSHHAVRAVQAAFKVQDSVRVFNAALNSPGQELDSDLNADWSLLALLSEHWPRGHELEVGIGIESGLMLIGVLGTSDLIHLGAVGDAVNVAARVQSLTKELGHSILLTANVRDHLLASGAPFHLQGLGAHKVKGRTQPVELFAPQEDPQAQSPLLTGWL
jgi:class 3 adenylate cyclase/CHASE2 domain-containing sensor protein